MVAPSELRRLVTYGLVGLVSNGVAFAVYALLAEPLGLAPVLAMTLVYVSAATVGFWGNRQLTFAHEGAVLGAVVRYVIAYGLGYLLNLAILVTFVDHLGYPHLVVQAGAVIVVAAFLFVVLGAFVFPDRDQTSDEQRAAPARGE